MNIGSYTFAQFKEKAAAFHGYPAPGLLVGAYMVETAKAALPDGTLFEAVVETKKCLPDAVQLLTLCSTGNQWMKVVDLGKYAVSLYDKYTGEGFRVHLDTKRVEAFPEIASWFLKRKPKAEQDSGRLFREIETAGNTICAIAPIRIRPRLVGHGHMGLIAACPHCGEAYPADDGLICRGCQGEAPYSQRNAVVQPSLLCDAGRSSEITPRALSVPATPPQMEFTPFIVPVEEAIGREVLHDMTEIIPGESKDAVFKAGQTITVGDVCRLQQMGRFNVAIVSSGSNENYVHENAGVEAFAARMAGENIVFDLPPKEGKVNFRATVDGLFTLDRTRLLAFNMVPDVMCATRQDAVLVQAGSEVAGSRVIPLFIHKDTFAQALHILNAPLFRIAPLRQARVGVLVTGTEVFQGLIEDKFIPVISAKVKRLGCSIVAQKIVPDDTALIKEGIEHLRAAGADLLITTGGMSVDPDDVTRAALMQAGMTDYLYGAPVLPGTMSLVGYLPPASDAAFARNEKGFCEGAMQVLGVPACALYFKTTLFDVLLPRLLAGRQITRQELALLGEGGFCMNCKRCTWPKCFFLK